MVKYFLTRRAMRDLRDIYTYSAKQCLMVPTGKHFLVYKTMPQGIIIATILHSRRDIETIVAQISPQLTVEIEKLERKVM